MSLDQDVTVEIGGKEYKLIIDTQALSRFEEWLNSKSSGRFHIGWVDWWQETLKRAKDRGGEGVWFPLQDGLYLLWCALQRHHKKQFRDIKSVEVAVTNPFDVMGGDICVALINCWNKHLPQADDTEQPDDGGEGDGDGNTDGEDQGNPLPENGGT